MPTPYYRQRDSGFAAVTHRSVWSPVRVHGGPCSRALPFAGRCEGPGPMSSPTPPMQGTLRPRLSHISKPAPSSGWPGSLRVAVCGRSFARPSPGPLTRVPTDSLVSHWQAGPGMGPGRCQRPARRRRPPARAPTSRLPPRAKRAAPSRPAAPAARAAAPSHRTAAPLAARSWELPVALALAAGEMTQRTCALSACARRVSEQEPAELEPAELRTGVRCRK